MEFQRKSHSLLFIISKLWGGLLIPFLSHSLCPLFPLILFPSLWRLLISMEFWCPLLLPASFPAGCSNHKFPWLLVSRILGFPCLCVICASSFFSHYVFLLCYLSLLPYHLSVPLASYSHVLCFSIFLSTYFLSFTFWSRSLCLSVYTPAHISEFLGSCILVCFTGSVSVAYLHPLIGGAFSFTRKHTKCSSDCLKEIWPGGGQLYWTAGVAISLNRKFLRERNIFH